MSVLVNFPMISQSDGDANQDYVLGRQDISPIHIRLKQPAALWPFMREFIVLFEIAARAGDNQIVGIIKTITSDRNNVIDMEFFAEFLFAIVALAFLPLELVYLILRGMVAAHRPLTSAASMCLCSTLLGMSGIPLLFSLKQFVSLGKIALSIVLLLKTLKALEIFGVLLPLATPFSFYLRAGCIVFLAALFTYTSQAIATTPQFGKVLNSRRFYRFTDRASFMPWRGSLSRSLSCSFSLFAFINTLLALVLKAIKSGTIAAEKFIGSRFVLLAQGALLLRSALGYSVHTVEPLIQSSRLRGVSPPAGANHYYPCILL